MKKIKRFKKMALFKNYQKMQKTLIFKDNTFKSN